MTLSASFIWKNADATRDLNARLRRIVKRGIVFGGDVGPGIGLTVTVAPSVAVSYDGMTVVESQQQILTVIAGQTRYICLWVKYNDGGIPATPTLQWTVLEAASYNAHPEKDYLIVYARVVVPAFAVSVLADHIYYDVRDAVDPLGRDWFRGRAPTFASLPTPPPHMNLVGDFYYVDADNTFYFWTGAAWEPIDTGSSNTEIAFMNKYLADMEQARFVEGSGIIGGVRPHPDASFASETDLTIIATPLVANQIAVDAFTAYVNGHRIQVHAQNIALPAKPAGPGDRYDIVFLEVWRETIAVPESFAYHRNPTGALTYTIQEAEDNLESLTYATGLAGDNFNLNQIEPYVHDWRAVRWRIGTAQNIPSSALYNPSAPAVSGVCENIDGLLAFTSQPAGTGTDDRMWISPSVATADGYTWAIPLLVLRRTASEVPGNEVQIFRNGIRYVFPVYPVADTSQAMRLALDTQYRQEPTPFTLDHYPYDEPSGFLSGMDHQIETKTGTGRIAVYEDHAHIRIRGIEDWIQLAGGPNVTLPTPPVTAGANAWARHLVYLKMNITLYANGSGTSTVNQFISQRHHPYIPSDIGGDVRGQGWKRGYVTFEYVATDLGNNDYLDEYDAMTAAGWVRGDLTMATKNAQYEDGGVWSRAIAIDADDRVHPYETEWAIPVCLIHRRNTQVWHYNTNPNGSLTRPDWPSGLMINPATLIIPDDLADLRHEVGVDAADLERRLYSDFDKNMKGQLRTRMANKYRGAGTGGTVAGSRILQSDSIGGLAGTFQLTAADGVRGIWSDAKEFFPVSVSFDLKLDYIGVHPCVHYTASTGVLKIIAPGFTPGVPPTADASIIRHIPTVAYVDGRGAAATHMDFLGPPCWTTQSALDPFSAPLSASHAKLVNTVAKPAAANIPFSYYINPASTAEGQSFTVTETNALGKAIEMEAIVDIASLPASADATLSFWVHYDRSFDGEYSGNYGLAEVPDTVWNVIKDPNGTPENLNLGPIYTVVRKTMAATDTVTITAANVSAVSGLPGTVSLCWVDLASIRYSSNVTANIVSMTMSHARDSITITYDANVNADVDFIVLFYTDDVNKWVEIGRGGKSIQAAFNWHESGELDATTSSSAFAYNLEEKTWRSPTVTGRQLAAPFIWTRAASGVGDWSAELNLTGSMNYENSNIVACTAGGAGGRYVLIIVPALTPLTNAASDNILIHYTYTPYQGLSSAGGDPAMTVTAVPKLKQLLHGTIEQNTDFFVTQSGACSYYSGVEVWSGRTPNFSFMATAFSLEVTRGLFEEYVTTSVVNPTYINSGGTQNIVASETYASTLNAAAVYRLPFPSNHNMFLTDYHTGCMEFDLDPGRIGAGAGYLTFAPSYDPLFTGLIRYDQFVNALNRLAVPGRPFSTDQSIVVTPAEYMPAPDNDTAYKETGYWGDIVNAYLDIPVRCRGANVVKRIRTLMETELPMNLTGPEPYAACELVHYQGNMGEPTLIFDTQAKANIASSYFEFGSGGAENVYFTLSPGPIIANYNVWAMNVTPLVKIRVYSALGESIAIKQTDAVIESEDYFRGANDLMSFTSKTVDLIIMPFTSYSTKSSTPTIVTNPQQRHKSANSITSLAGLMVQYPNDWPPATATAIDALYQASEDHLGHGRGLYVGSTTRRYNAPVFVPGSGTFLDEILGDLSQHIDYASSAPQPLPYMPAEPMFASSYTQYFPNDHGGPLAYCGFGIAMRPSSDEYKNQVVMQISGGPTGGTYSGKFTPNDLAGTAIDAFWPTGRPVLKSRK